ncbi:nicotinamide/nicotinic acid mononucleotide adenylyltransferase isoform X1 [Hevea brasiliensis]|uniref:nicotinamide/nicotinic acid mononucleotide adenylyltransferase isoform X1 n=1 Tax=Hevea brasiliensis TaxID=3981 RepID=UPI0025FD4632|nr:nicotinamide/nicotinic acid mononucleotide adenylyltransferase isoform X1 [Hevea brasiliensis]
MDLELPMDKVSLGSNNTPDDSKINVVLVATGSFNPPTFMHLRMFELARDALHSEGYHVVAAYMSPVSDAYKKQSLISGEHRLRMCNLASESSDFIMVDPWEANQSTYQRTLTILKRIESYFIDNKRLISRGSCLFVVLIYSNHLAYLDFGLLSRFYVLQSMLFGWKVRTICREYGVVCICREGQDVEKIISDNEILNENRSNIKVVDELVSNSISSTRLRYCISRGLSIKYLTIDGVIEYIREHRLYMNSIEK